MILVTGASGLLGASVVLQAKTSGREVVGLYHEHPIHVPGVQTQRVELTSASDTRSVIRHFRPQAIIHCAAAANVDWCEDHPHEAEQVNVGASRLLAELAAELNCQLIYVSTDSVFDGIRENYSEVDEAHPINIYAHSKLRGEGESQRHRPGAIIARVNIFGWNAQPKQSLAEWVLGRLQAGQRVPGFTDVIFCPMLVNDLAEVLFSMLDARLGGIYHVVASERISKYEFARRIAVHFGFDPEMVYATSVGDARLRAPRPRNLSLTTTKIQSALGTPMPDVVSGLRRFKALSDRGYAEHMKSLMKGASA
jgi:dTDP-4-dehydrorhamnose reductase